MTTPVTTIVSAFVSEPFQFGESSKYVAVDAPCCASIFLSESSETVYWLEIIKDLNRINSNKTKPILTETKELLAIFTSIGKNLKN